jgi:hypothetical protein
LRHRHAAGELSAIFGREAAREQFLDVAELSAPAQRLGPVADFAQSFGVSGDPSEAMNEMLFAVDAAAIEFAAARDARLDRCARGGGVGLGLIRNSFQVR